MDAATMDRRASFLLTILGLWARLFQQSAKTPESKTNFAEIERQANEVAGALLERRRGLPDFSSWLQEQKTRRDVLGRLARGEEVSMNEFPELSKVILRTFPHGGSEQA